MRSNPAWTQRSKPVGWRNESFLHSLAGKGISAGKMKAKPKRQPGHVQGLFTIAKEPLPVRGRYHAEKDEVAPGMIGDLTKEFESDDEKAAEAYRQKLLSMGKNPHVWKLNNKIVVTPFNDEYYYRKKLRRLNPLSEKSWEEHLRARANPRPKKISEKQVKIGTRYELRHTTIDPEVARLIAVDNVKRSPRHYVELVRAERAKA